MITGATAAGDPLAALLQGVGRTASSPRPEWFSALQSQARSHYLATGLPTRRDESWKYTDLQRLRLARYASASATELTRPVGEIPGLLSPKRASARMVFVNGGFRPDLSSIEAPGPRITLEPLSAALRRQASDLASALAAAGPFATLPMVALNTALMEDGVLVDVDRGAPIDRWLELVFVGGAPSSIAFAPRHVVRLAEAAQFGIVEHYVGFPGESYFANTVMQIELGAGATLRHYRILAGDGVDTVTTAVHVAEDASYEGFALIKNGSFTRVESNVDLAGPRAECRLGGAYVVGGTDFCDNTTVISHRAPKTISRQVFKGVIDDAAHAVFQGRVIVERRAQEADGRQLSKALLLSESAEIDQKPALEIFADNVKCSHGAAAGQLDQGAMFYLRSRGIPENRARQILLEGFLAEVLLEISDEDVRRGLAAEAVAAVRETRKGKG